MLSREQAEARLKEFQIKNWKKTRIDELGKLPVALKTTGRMLLDVDPDGKAWRNWEKQYKARSKATENLGKLGRYSLHMGSGIVHRQPGGSLCIIAVQAQQRGRLFLPFFDDDPRTAEVISKVLLLAKDYEIQDPSILEQLR